MRRICTAVVANAAAVVFAMSAWAASSAVWTTYSPPPGGFSIAVPAGWQYIPQGRDAQLALVDSLRSKGETGRAALVDSYMTDTTQNVPGRLFDATQFPEPPGAIATDVIVSWQALPVSDDLTKKGFAQVASVVYGQLKVPGSAMGSAKAESVSLSAGAAYLIYGLFPTHGDGGARTADVLYLILGHGGLFSIEFRTDSPDFGTGAATFRAIAGTFKVE
jgi:hypothetical protein